MLDNVLMAFGALKAHFHYSSSLIASPIKCHQDVLYALQKLFKDELDQLQKLGHNYATRS